MDLEVIVTPGLGDNSYVLLSGDEAAVVDPQRDIGRYLETAAAGGATIRHVLETHVHNDYLSGGLELRAATGAEIGGPAGARYEFPVRSLDEGDEIQVGEVRLVVMRTPGHTPEHVAYLVHDAGRRDPRAVFTGGSLMVGTAGRTDLLGAALADELTRAQFRSLRRLARLPDQVEVLPTHGAGSFCGAGSAPAERTSTMAQERVWNIALRVEDEEAFVRQQLSNLLAYPDYYAHMAPINRAGPPLVAKLQAPRPLRPDELADLVDEGAWVIDGRGRADFAAGHVPGSLNIELDDSFASYVGWVVPFDQRFALVLASPEEDALSRARVDLLRVGYERLEGYLLGGIEAWRGSGRAVSSYGLLSHEDVCAGLRSEDPPILLDVRQDVEWNRRHVPGSTHVFVGDLPDRMEEVPRDREVWAVCASGHRSAIAASLLDREGVPVRLVPEGGIRDVLAVCPEVRAAPRG